MFLTWRRGYRRHEPRPTQLLVRSFVSLFSSGLVVNWSLAYKSIQTVGSLLLTNSDFRLFLSDLSTVGREVFQDTAFTLSTVSKEAGQRLGPSKEEQQALINPGSGDDLQPTQQDLQDQTAEISEVVADGATKVAREAEDSIANKVKGDEGDALAFRLKRAVTTLRNRPDYSDSVSTLSLLLKRYAKVYSHAARDVLQAVDEDVDHNPETDQALHNFYLFATSFGDQEQWKELEARFSAVIDHSREDPEFDDMLSKLGNAIQEMLLDPTFFDRAEERFQDLRATSRQLASGSTLREDVDGLLAALQSTFQSVLRDKDIASILDTAFKIFKILSPTSQHTNPDLAADLIHVFVPLLIRSLKYIPIPRLELSTPAVDLLLENLILEPGETINDSSFLPHKLRVETYNDLEIRKGRFRTATAVKTMMRIKLDGLSIRAEEMGFWLRARSGLFRLADQGIAAFKLDDRGIDIHLDVEVGKDRVDNVLSLRNVRVHIHKLDWTIRRSKFSLFSWIMKPLLKPIIRKSIEVQVASAIADALQFANRELLYARERLRATRISNPEHLGTFLKAVFARLIPPDDPDFQTRVGVDEPGEGVFRGVYTPGSIVKVWNEEAARAPVRIREHEREGWRNDIFDVHTSVPS